LFSGQAARFGVRENDKLVTINGKTPRNVDDAVGVIKQAGNNIKLVCRFFPLQKRPDC
jgi:PDZ domain